MGDRPRLVYDKPFAQLVREFDLCAHVKEVFIPPELYHQNLHLYRAASAMHEAMSKVMNDGEHSLMIEEGRRFFKLPDNQFMVREIEDLDAVLKSFDPFHAATNAKGEVVISESQGEGFMRLFASSYNMVHEAFEVFRNTDYFKLLRHMRNVQRTPYAGPSAMAEISQVYFALCRTHKSFSHYMDEIIDAQEQKIEERLEKVLAEGTPLELVGMHLKVG